MTRIRKLLTVLATVAVAVLVAVPASSAQGPATQQSATLTFEKTTAPTSPIVPDGVAQDIKIDWKYTVTGQGGQLGFAQTTATTLTWSTPVCTDTQVQITGPLSQSVTVDPTEQGASTTGVGNFKVSATTEAKGEIGLTCTFKGKVEAVGSAVAESNEPETKVPVIVGYFGLVQAKSLGRLKEAAPQKTITYTIEVTNFGNARTNVAFTTPTEPGKWNPILPEPLILESKLSGIGGDVQSAEVQIATPFKNGWNNDEKAFKVILTPTSSKTGTAGGNPVEVNVLARVRGVYVPTLEPLVMLGAVFASAALLRMQRED